MLYEIQMNDRFFYAKGRTEAAAISKIKKAFGTHFSNPFATGRVKYQGVADA